MGRDLSPSTILVTGGAGFIGSHLVDRLLAEGHRVVCLDDFNDFYDPLIKRANVAAHEGNPSWTLIEGDICDESLLAEVFRANRFDSVVHLAARAGVRPSVADPGLYERVNIRGTLNLLEQCRHQGVPKLVFGSSSSVYGVNAKVPFSETDPIDKPISPYAATKAAGESLCHVYSHLYGIRIVCLRFFTVYGPRQRPDLAIHKFARLIEGALPVPLYGNGTSKRDYTFIEDILTGVLGALAYRDTPFEIVNLGESQTVDLLELVRALEDALGKKAIIDWQPPQPGDVPITYADVSKARRLFGYEPTTPIARGIESFVRWFRTMKSLREDAFVLSSQKDPHA